MFTLEQIKGAHSKVKSGADFPAYIQEIKKLGVTFYETFVVDGHTDYYGEKDYKISTVAKYNPLSVSDKSNINDFRGLLLSPLGAGMSFTILSNTSSTFC